MVVPARSTIWVCWASGCVRRLAGRSSTVWDSDLAPIPRTPANGIARPATTTPMTAATIAITPRWEVTILSGQVRRSLGGTDMAASPELRGDDQPAVVGLHL